MIRMSSDSNIVFRCHQTDKMSIRECSIPAFLSKNVGPKKVVRN